MEGRKRYSPFALLTLGLALALSLAPAILADGQSAAKRIHETFGLVVDQEGPQWLDLDPGVLSLIESGRYDLAVDKADEVIQKDPAGVGRTPSAYVCKVFCYMQLHRYDRAISCCESLRGQYRDDNRAHLGTGESMRLWIDFVVPSMLACVYLEKGDVDKALNELEGSIDKVYGNPPGAEATAQMLDSLAASLRGRGLYRLSIAEYDRILQKSPDDVSVVPGCYHGKVWAYIGLKDYDKALQTCDALAKRYEDSTVLSAGSGVPMNIRIGGAHGLRAKVYEAQQNWGLAIQEYQRQLDFLKQPGVLDKIPASQRHLIIREIEVDLPNLIEQCRARMSQ